MNTDEILDMIQISKGKAMSAAYHAQLLSKGAGSGLVSSEEINAQSLLMLSLIAEQLVRIEENTKEDSYVWIKAREE